ncbi:MAG: ABC transporter substrate-binding protein [Psychrobacter sp.]|uniref:ABC transporter substrate-binding protein n=1 Tax=unclassified Psychrobacter TaxID=196806 RepID=UPI0017884BFD|nr:MULTISPECIES: ABC transporter substrate-binding protein [unclassified Psychrobacter]MBE0442743.1 ABC transporter substrate-binding protein [Psychrobacter sp. FME13]
MANAPLTLTLEWFLNPDHLPFIAGIHTGAYSKAGLDINMIEPTEHYDGFAELEAGNIDLHVNEPIHLFEHYFEDLKALGCFFVTDGGVLIKQSSLDKLHNNQPIRITTPASNPITNKIGFEILSRYAKKNGFVLDIDNVDFVETDFQHLQNLQEGDAAGEFDGAWLCFYNFEGIEANYVGLEYTFIDQHLSPYPNFSALELMTTHSIWQEKSDALTQFVAVSTEMAQLCIDNPQQAREIYYGYTGEAPSALMDDIINDTLKRLIAPIKPNAERWTTLREMLATLDIANISDANYAKLWQ